MTELLANPCKRCGKKPNIIVDSLKGVEYHTAMCIKCGMGSHYLRDEYSAKIEWNRLNPLAQVHEPLPNLHQPMIASSPVESSVEIAESAKGPRVTVKVYDRDPETAAQKALDVYQYTMEEINRRGL